MTDLNSTSEGGPAYRIVPMVGHGEELAGLVRALNEGFYLTDVGEHAYTLKRDGEANDAST